MHLLKEGYELVLNQIVETSSQVVGHCSRVRPYKQVKNFGSCGSLSKTGVRRDVGR